MDVDQEVHATKVNAIAIQDIQEKIVQLKIEKTFIK